MNDARLLRWRRRLGISPAMDKRLRRMVTAVEREEREACVDVVNRMTECICTDRLIAAIRERKP
jgi:hypothetical protein